MPTKNSVLYFFVSAQQVTTNFRPQSFCMNYKILLTSIGVFLILSCHSSRNTLKHPPQSSMIDSIELTLKKYFADVKQYGLKGEFAYLDSSADFLWIPPGHRSPISYDSVASILRKYQLFYTSVDNSQETLTIKPITNHVATYSGRIRSIMLDSSGKKSDLMLVETGVVVKRTTGWKLRSGQTSVLTR